jgi:hypothetical protein
MSHKKEDFDKDIPRDKLVSGTDAFVERGCHTLFVEMIGAAAKDLSLPHDDPNYVDSLQWVSDPANLRAWCCMIGANLEVAPTIQKAILERPVEIAHACEIMVRASCAETTTYSAFMEAMGVGAIRNASSIDVDSDFECQEGVGVWSLYSAS